MRPSQPLTYRWSDGHPGPRAELGRGRVLKTGGDDAAVTRGRVETPDATLTFVALFVVLERDRAWADLISGSVLAILSGGVFAFHRRRSAALRGEPSSRTEAGEEGA